MFLNIYLPYILMLCIVYNDDLANFWSLIIYLLFIYFLSPTRQTERERERERERAYEDRRDEVREEKHTNKTVSNLNCLMQVFY